MGTGMRVVNWFAAVSPTECQHLSGHPGLHLFVGVLGLGLQGDSSGEWSWASVWVVQGALMVLTPDPSAWPPTSPCLPSPSQREGAFPSAHCRLTA